MNNYKRKFSEKKQIDLAKQQKKIEKKQRIEHKRMELLRIKQEKKEARRLLKKQRE